MPYSGQATTIRGATEQAKRQNADMQTNLLPFITKLISGEHIEGMTPRTAQKLMGIVSPQVAQTMHDRGHAVDPNWYQNYIDPGVVNPQTYQNAMQYALGFSNAVPELRDPAMQVWNESPFQVGGFVPNYQQQQLQNWDTQVRMGLQGQVLDPYTGMYVQDPNITWDQLAQQSGSLQNDYAISQLVQGLIELLGGTSPIVNDASNQGVVQPILPQREPYKLTPPGAEPSSPFRAQGSASYVPQTQAPVRTAEEYKPQVDTMWSQAALVDQSEKLGIDYQEYIAAHDMAKDYLAKGGNPAELDVLLRSRFGITLNDITEVEPNWWVRNFPGIKGYVPPRK